MAKRTRKTTRKTSSFRRSGTATRRVARRSGGGARTSRRSAARVSGRGAQTIRLVLEQPAAVPVVASPQQAIAQALTQIAVDNAQKSKDQKAKF